MGDSTKFQWTTEYYAFHVLLLLLVISEVYIFCYTHSGVENWWCMCPDRSSFDTKESIHIKCPS